MDKNSLLQEIDRRGWYIREGEIYKKVPFKGRCLSIMFIQIDKTRAEMRAVMKETGLSLEEALVEVFRRRDRDYELHGDLPTFLRKEVKEE